ncbi:MAG: hypothetical protein ACOX2K_03010 [Bacillota bacterium]|jgi:hypothetical protein
MRWQRRSRLGDKLRPARTEQGYNEEPSGLQKNENYLYWNSIEQSKSPQ